jgi:Ca-activated chloride channel family protein
MRICSLLLGLCWLTQAIPARDTQERAVFSSRSELVALHVSVVDRHADFVAGLPRQAFTIYEEGKEQKIAFFENSDAPVTVGLVMDNSGSMTRTRGTVIEAGMAFSNACHPEDEMFVVHFNERVWPGLNPPVYFTTDREQLRVALLRSTARGQTALFDAVLTGLERLTQGHHQKKALVVISDGGDNASRTRFEDVLATALRMDALVYSVGLYDSYDHDANPDLLRKLARSTGAEAFFPRRPSEVGPILSRIARELRSGYTIGYVPSTSLTLPGYRKIEVRVHAPDGRKLRARARAGYTGGLRASGVGAK